MIEHFESNQLTARLALGLFNLKRESEEISRSVKKGAKERLEQLTLKKEPLPKVS
jgi:hypothetical protein